MERKLLVLKKFDIFNKTDRAILKKHSSGGVVTLIGALMIVLLILVEILSFRSIEIIETIGVDTSRETHVTIRYDITFHEMKCDDLSMDLVDQNGLQQEPYPDDYIQKIPKPFVMPERSYNICAPCFPSVTDICCTCNEVKEYYSTRTWINALPTESSQCRQEPEYNYRRPRTGEGCHIIGRMTALKGSGNFHVAPGVVSNSPLNGHTHTINPFNYLEELHRSRLSHTIHYLNFGNSFLEFNDTLDGVSLFTDDIVRHVYYLRLVPTIFIDSEKQDSNDDSGVIFTNQYSATNHTEVIDLFNSFSIQMPGVFWKYDFSPMLIQLEKKEKYFSHLLTRLCAVVGGVWVVVGLLYSFAQYWLLIKLQKRPNKPPY